MGTRKNELAMKSKIGTAQWESDPAEQIESLRSGIQNLSSTVERIAKEQIPRARSRATEALNDAEEAVKQNPLAVVAIALGLGLLIGVLTRR